MAAARMSEEDEEQVGRLLILFNELVLASNLINNLIVARMAKYEKGYTYKARNDYNNLVRMSKKISLIVDDMINEAIPALETDSGDNSYFNVADTLLRDTNSIILYLMQSMDAMTMADNDAIVKLSSYAKTLAKGNEFFNEKTKDYFRDKKVC